MYTSFSDADEESTSAFQWRVWGSDSSPSAPAMAVTLPAVSFWGDSRDGAGAATASITKSPSALSMAVELAPFASSAASWSSGVVASNTRGVSNASYKGVRTSSGSTTPAELVAHNSEGKCTPSQQAAAASADLILDPERHSGDMRSGAGVATFKYTPVSSAVEPPPSAMPVTFHDSDDGVDDAFDIIKESIKHQLVSIEEDDRVSDATRDSSAIGLRQRLQLPTQPQQHCCIAVQLPGGTASKAAGACWIGSDDRTINISGASALPAPRSTAAVRQREMTTTRCSSSFDSILKQLAACIGQPSVSTANAPLASGSSSDANSFRSQPMTPRLQPPHVSTQKAGRLTSLQQQQSRQRDAQTVMCPPSTAASCEAFFEQQRQPSATGVDSTAGNANTSGDAKIRTGGLRIPLPTSGARTVGDGRSSGGVAAVPTFADGVRRPSSHLDPSREIGSGAAAASTRPSATPPTASSSPEEESATAGHEYNPHPYLQYSHQLHPASSAAQLRHNLFPHQPEIPSLYLEDLQEKHAARRKQERIRDDTWRHQQQQPSAPPPPPPKSVQISSSMSFQGGPRFPNLPAHLQPQSLPQTQHPSHLEQPLSQSQSQHSQQQQLGGSASSSSVAMGSGKTYAATPQGRLIALTPEGARASLAQPLQELLLLPPPPPPPPNATALALTGNYVTASSYSTLFCCNNPLHAMRYPGSELQIATSLEGDSGHPKSGKTTVATPSSHAERPGAQTPKKTASFAASEKHVPRSLIAGQSRGGAAANQAEVGVTVSSTVVTKSNLNVEVSPLPTCHLGAATGASVAIGSLAVTGGNCGRSAAASVSSDTQPPTGSVASLLARSSPGSAHCASIVELVQHLSSDPSSGSSANVAGRPLHLPAFPPREDVSHTSPAGGAQQPKRSPVLSAPSSNGAAKSLLSRVQPMRADPDRSAGMGMAKSLAVPSIGLTAGGSSGQMARHGKSNGNHSARRAAVSISSESLGTARRMSPSSNAHGDFSTFAELLTGVKIHNSGHGADTAGTGDSGHASCFTHLAPKPVLSPLASSAPFNPLVAVASAKSSGGSVHVSAQAACRQEPTGNRQPVARAGTSAHVAKLTWPDTVAQPLTQDPVLPLPQQRQPQQQQQQLHMQGSSPLFSASCSPAGSRLHAAVDDSIVVTIPVTNADGTITAAVVAVPPLFAHTEAGVQQYLLAAVQRQYSQQQRQCQSLRQQHHLHQGAPAEEQPSAIGAGEAEEWRRHQALLTLQLEQHCQRLENDLCQAQQQESPPLARVSMTTNDRRLHSIATASSVEAFVTSGQPYRNLHSVHGDTLAREDVTAVADGHADAVSLHPYSRPDVRMHVSPHAEL